MDREQVSPLVFWFAVDSLTYAFHVLEGTGFELRMPAGPESFEIVGEDREYCAVVLRGLRNVAPLASECLIKLGQSDMKGMLAYGAMAEAFDRYQSERT